MPGYKNDEIELLIKNYGNDFIKNYGWTKDVIKNTSDRNLKYIASDVGLDSLDQVYKVTSNFIHTNAYSAFLKNQITPNYVRQFIPIMSSILVRHIIFYVSNIYKNENEILILNFLLQGMEKALFPELLS